VSGRQQVWFTVSEIAAMLNVSARTVRRWAAAGKIKAVKIGGEGNWRIRMDNRILAEMAEMAEMYQNGRILTDF
jgi:excisionase family DNA binding protein